MAHETDLGDVYLADPDSRGLSLVAQRGLSLQFMADFQALEIGDRTSVGEAARGCRALLDDSDLDRDRVDAHAGAARDAEFQWAFSYPMLLGRRVVGVVSARFRRTARHLSAADACALGVRIAWATERIQSLRSAGGLPLNHVSPPPLRAS